MFSQSVLRRSTVSQTPSCCSPFGPERSYQWVGERFTRSTLEPLELGTFGVVPKNMAHFAWSKTETIIQVHGIDPFGSTLVDPVYEITEKGVFVLTSLLQPGRPASSSPPDCFALKIGALV
jgi:hypothetical protein